MIKKLTVAAIVTLVLAVPAFASASTGLTESGVLVPVGSIVRGTNVAQFTVTSSIGDWTCNSVSFNARVTKNNETEGVAGSGEGEGTPSTCSFKGNAIKVTNFRFVSLSSTSAQPGKGTISLSFEADLPVLTCKYSATSAPFTYTSGTDVIQIDKASLSVSPAACGSAKLDWLVTFTTSGGGPGLIWM